MQSWLEGRNWVGKCAQATSLRILSSKADSNTWESFTRSELKLESVHQESPRSDIFRKRATKPLLKQKHRQKQCLKWKKVSLYLHGLAYRLQLGSSSKHWGLHIEQPQTQHLPTSTHWWQSTFPPEVWDLLVSDASCHRKAQNHSPEHSLSPFLAGGMIFPPPSGMLDPCQSSSNNWKLISFNTTWHHHNFPPKKLKQTVFIFIYSFFC